MFRTLLGCTLVLLVVSATAYSQSPYVGQESREIKALSPQEISDYLSGKGMGLAKAAELNGYPGPAHVIELAAELELTPEQKTKTEVCSRKCRLAQSLSGRSWSRKSAHSIASLHHAP
jgi:hypothetical protein